MYEDRNYENIMSEMMDGVPEDIDQQEGSLVYISCSKMAALAEEIYTAIDETQRNMLPDTADLEHLIQLGAEMGIPIIEATGAIFKAKFNIAMEIGTELDHTEQDLSYVITEVIDDSQHIYKVECLDAGAEANRYLGNVEPAEVVAGFESGELIELVIAGKDEESEDDYRFRILNSTETRSFAGNKAYYIEEVGQLEGVGGVKAMRITGNPNYNVLVQIVTKAFGTPDESLISAVQKAVDPEQTGEGNGLAPIGAKVKIIGAEAVTVSVSAKITTTSGISVEDIRSQLDQAVNLYFAELNQKWSSTDGQKVRLAKAESYLMDVKGVEDVEQLTLNGSAANINITTAQVVKKGETIWIT